MSVSANPTCFYMPKVRIPLTHLLGCCCSLLLQCGDSASMKIGKYIHKSARSVSALRLQQQRSLSTVYQSIMHADTPPIDSTSTTCASVRVFSSRSSINQSINQSINLYCTPRGRIKNKINEIKYNNTAHIKYTSEKKN